MKPYIQRHKTLFEEQTKFKESTKHFNLGTNSYEFAAEKCKGGKVPTIYVSSYQALVRAVGYFHYNHHHSILLRGQNKCFGSMIPSAYRSDKENPSVDPVDVDAGVTKFVRYVQDLGVLDPDLEHQSTTEPLLQHYGWKTRWLDVVDSIPHALFFAIYSVVSSPRGHNLKTICPSLEKMGFISLISVGAIDGESLTVHKGLQKTVKKIEVCDLRRAKPSIALRPHAQHGLLCREEGGGVDLWPHVVAHIGFHVSVARNWIMGEAFTRESMFPGRKFDGIYSSLTSSLVKAKIQKFTPGKFKPGTVDVYDFSEFQEGGGSVLES